MANCTVTGNWSVKITAFVHELTQRSGGVVTVNEVVRWSGTSYFLGEQSRLVNLRGNEVKQ